MNVIFLLLVVIGILIIIYMWFEAHRNRVREQTIKMETLPKCFDGFRLFFISDIHRREISNTILQQIKGQCDMIIIGGDLLEKGVPISRIERNLKKLSEVAPTYFIWGNNDLEIDAKLLRRGFEKYRIHELKNEFIKIERFTESIGFLGVDEDGYRQQGMSIFQKVNHVHCAILVSHFPKVIDYLPNDHMFSLCLSGHTHGGQIRLFGWGIAEKGGLKKRKGLIHIISNGYGTTGLPFRLGAPAETHLFTFRKG